MEKMHALLINIEGIDNEYCRLLFDISDIIGDDEICELKICKRRVRELLQINLSDFESFLKLPGEERRKIIKNSPNEMEIRRVFGFSPKLKYK